jgi:hypothetical protein
MNSPLSGDMYVLGSDMRGSDGVMALWVMLVVTVKSGSAWRVSEIIGS